MFETGAMLRLPVLVGTSRYANTTRRPSGIPKVTMEALPQSSSTSHSMQHDHALAIRILGVSA